jgi:predicted nucleic acid-binding protein
MRNSALTVVFDACVLYPAPLRDFLMRLALTGAFRARWSERIHDEWMRNVLLKFPELADALTRTRQLMNAAVPDCIIEVDDILVSSLVLPDPDDRHVLAVALRCKASAIVTFNLKDFPHNILATYGIEPQHPDQFVDVLFNRDPAAVIEAAVKQRASLRKPMMSTEKYLDCLLRQGMTQTVKNLSGFQSIL